MEWPATEPITEMSGNTAEYKYLAFLLEDRTWALPVGGIQEIIRPLKALPLPNAPHHVDGVINLRDSIIPLINLRTRLGLRPIEATERSAVIIVRLGDSSPAGFLVDAVEQVLSIPPEIVKPTPSFGPATNDDCLAGIAHLGDNGEDVITLLDVDQIHGATSSVPQSGANKEELDWFDSETATAAV